PGNRQNLSGEQLRNRALTDVFEPGSTMKPFIAGLALETHRVTPDTLVDTGNGKYPFQGAVISDTKPHGVISVRQVIQMS
ncbi:penicillin-binding transpeptidase domain-containing protein, partial [Klebsiella pneumoniae]